MQNIKEGERGGGGENGGCEKKIRNEELWEKNEKGEGKGRKITYKTGEKALKMHLFGL